MPTTPVWPKMKPKRRNMRMLSTLRVVGTNTPAKVPSLDVPPTGLGKAPGRGLTASVVRRLCSCPGEDPWGCFGDLERGLKMALANQSRMESMPWSLSGVLPGGLPFREAFGSGGASWPAKLSSGVSSLGAGDGRSEKRRSSSPASSLAERTAKLEWLLNGARRRVCTPPWAAMVGRCSRGSKSRGGDTSRAWGERIGG
jgi:hypothetical protein